MQDNVVKLFKILKNVVQSQFLARDLNLPLDSYQIARFMLIRMFDEFLIVLQFHRLTAKVTISITRKIVFVSIALSFFIIKMRILLEIHKNILKQFKKFCSKNLI